MVYNYYYADGLLVRQTWGSNYIDFLYDESGVFSFVYNGTQYFYIKNLQGDVVAIANASGAILVEYVYDAWGDVISITGTEASTLGVVNPIRYRGYYFDTDTEFYYLNSRYYDPEIRRFINADEYASTGQGFIGYNMYAYCGNNPISRIDDSGEFWTELWNEFTQLVTQSQGVLVTAGAISQLDTPAPGPADVVAGIMAGATILACLGIATYYTVSEAVTTVSIPRVEVKEKEKEAVIADTKTQNKKVYYHSTTQANAAAIISTGIMEGSVWEGGYVYAWKTFPSPYAIENSGAHFGVIIAFETDMIFTLDPGIVDPEVLVYGPVVSVVPGPISVRNVIIVG